MSEEELDEGLLIDNIPLESSDEDVFIPESKRERRQSRRAGIKFLLVLFIVVPISLLPAILLVSAGHVKLTSILEGNVGSGPDFATEIARVNVFLSSSFFFITVLSLVSYGFARGFSHPNLFMVRHYVVIAGGLLVVMLLGGVFLYESTLIKDVSVIASYVRQRPKSSSTGGAEVETVTGFVYIFEHVCIALIIVVLFLGFERVLVEKLKVAFHRVSFQQRLKPMNEVYSLMARCYARITKQHQRKKQSLFLEEYEGMSFETEEDTAKVVNALFGDLNEVRMEDLTKVISEKDAKGLLDWLGDSDAVIDKDAAVSKFNELRIERQQAREQLQGNYSIINKLHKILRFIFFIIGGSFAAPFFDFGTYQVWITYGVIIGTLGFLFKGAAKTAFESLIFVFVRHPFDVGDEVIVDGAKLRVAAIRIFITEVRKVEEDDNKMYIPNSRLMDKNVVNLTRQKKNQ